MEAFLRNLWRKPQTFANDSAAFCANLQKFDENFIEIVSFLLRQNMVWYEGEGMPFSHL